MAIRAEDLPHFSVDEYLALAKAAPGALGRTELIDGVIYSVSPESHLHARAAFWIALQLEKRFPGLVVPGVSVQFPSSSSMWQPDVCVVRSDIEVDDYPQIRDLKWAIEVCLTTRHRDLGSKLRGYARADVSEYWVVNPEEGGWLLAHTDPGDGTYQQVRRTELPGGYRDLRFEGGI